MFSTMAMIGYGDYVPVSQYGRLTALIGWLIGAVAFSLILIYAQKQGDLTRGQSQAFSGIYQTKIAALIIQTALRYKILKKTHGPKFYKSVKTYKKLEKLIQDFKKNKIELKYLIKRKEMMLAEMKIQIKSLNLQMKKMEDLYKQLSKHLRPKFFKLARIRRINTF